MEASLWAALIAGVVSLAGAIVTGRLNRATVKAEKTLPPYDVLAGRVTVLEEQAEKDRLALIRARERADEIEARAEALETCYEKMERTMQAQQEWIKEAVALAEITGAISRLAEPPDWIDLESESMRQRREEMRNRHEPE